MENLKEQIQATNDQLKQVRRAIRALKVEEDGLSNKLDRLLTLSVNQTEIDFEQDKYFEQQGCPTSDREDGSADS
jgi:hypothetical protein